MNKIVLTFLLIFSFQEVNAIDRFVNPNLSIGNGTTLFTTVASAVNAAVNGDRILIQSGSYNEPVLNLGKSLTIVPQTPGTVVNFNSNLTISGFPGMKLEILGLNLGVYSIAANPITNGNGTNRAKISIIDCWMKDLSLDQDFYELNCARTTMSGRTTFRFGNFVISKTQDLFVLDESNQNLNFDKNFILCDTISRRLEYRNDDFQFVIANNLINNLAIYKWNNLVQNINKIINNEFIDSSLILIPTVGVPAYNFEFSSNKFNGLVLHGWTQSCGSGNVDGGYYDGNDRSHTGCWANFSYSVSGFPNPTRPGFFRWTYNGIDLPCTIPTGSQPLSLTKVIGINSTTIDAGNPNHDFYDIDLTVNDRGRLGGPYSILNFNPFFNTSNGKAFIFNLEMPADIFPGQSIDVKAKGYHRN